jgi:Biotin carboxylase, N-terminal domain
MYRRCLSSQAVKLARSTRPLVVNQPARLLLRHAPRVAASRTSFHSSALASLPQSDGMSLPAHRRADAPFTKLLAANRGEIATRINRAASELGIQTAGIYSHEDRFTQHRYKCDQAFELDGSKPPVAQYLDINTIVDICVKSE